MDNIVCGKIPVDEFVVEITCGAQPLPAIPKSMLGTGISITTNGFIIFGASQFQHMNKVEEGDDHGVEA